MIGQIVYVELGALFCAGVPLAGVVITHGLAAYIRVTAWSAALLVLVLYLIDLGRWLV